MAKTCDGCGKTHHKDGFRPDKRRRDGLASVCKTCEAEKAMMQTVDLPGVEIMVAGGPFRGRGSPPEGDFYDEEALARIAEASNAPDNRAPVKWGATPPIKIGHSREQRLLRASGLWNDDDEKPASGWMSNFRVANGKLVADVKDIPRKLADLIPQAFRTRSVEMRKIEPQDGSGGDGTMRVTALSLLGAKAPAVRTLDDIAALYEDVSAEPDEEVVVVDYEVGDAEGVVEFDDDGNIAGPGLTVITPGTEVVLSVAEMDERIASAVASAVAEAVGPRKTERPADTKGMEFTDEQVAGLRDKLGLDEDATGEQVLAKVGELHEKATAEPEPETENVGVSMSEDEFKELRDMAERGARAERTLYEDRRDRTIREAIDDHRIKVADQEKWMKRYDDNPETTTEILSELPVPADPKVYGMDSGDEPDEVKDLANEWRAFREGVEAEEAVA